MADGTQLGEIRMISNRIILVISCVILLAGCTVIYCFDNNDYTASVVVNSSDIEYSITGFMPCDYTFKVYTNADVPERLYLYYDENYESKTNIERQQIFFSDMERVLKARGYQNIEYVDANALKDLIDDPSKAPKSAIFFASGMMPDTVYGSTAGFIEWMDNGGTIIWSGPEIGLYVSHTSGYDTAESGRILKDHVNNGDPQDIETISDLGLATGFSLKKCIDYGLEKDYPGSVCLSTCSKDYSSASVLKYSNGRLFIIGGDITDSVLSTHSSLAEIIIGGINENSSIRTMETFHKGYGDVSGTFIASVSAGDSVILTIGQPYSSWMRGYGPF